MKTAELEGAALDYYVAKAEGLDIEAVRNGSVIIGRTPNRYAYSPSSKWDSAGPIIERERIELEPTVFDWSARVDGITGWWFAKTPLIAAMRAFVASKFGDEVEDIPSC